MNCQPQTAGDRKARKMTKTRKNTVQTAHLLRSNCVSWLPEAKFPDGGSIRSGTGSEASRAAGNAGPRQGQSP